MGQRHILHCDCNCFYASVEMQEHPELRGKSIAVCGDPEARHGIVLTASYPAKRMGVKTGMPIWEAKQHCRDLIIVPASFGKYQKYSGYVREVFNDYKLYGSSNAVPRQMRFRAAGQVGPLPEKQTIAFFIESNAGIIIQQKLRKHDLVALTDIPQPVDQQRCFTEKGKDVRIGSARGRICFQQERQQLCRKFGQRKSGGRSP